MRKSPTFLSYLSLALFSALILGASSGVKAQVIYNFAPGATNGVPVSVTTAGPFDWGTSTNWLGYDPTKPYLPGTGAGPYPIADNPFSGVPNGAGTLVNIMGDLTTASTTTTVTLSAPEIVGFLAIGDVNGNTDPYVLAANNAGNQLTNTLTFNMGTASGALGRATLQNFASGSSASWSTISANVNITSGILDVNEGSNNQFMTTLSGTVTGGEIYKIGYGALRITGNDIAAAGTGIVVEMRGAGDAGSIAFTGAALTPTSTQNANLILAAASGFAIATADGNGAVVDGNASRGGTGSAVIQLGGNNQIQNSLTLNFDGVSGSNPYFKLGGFSVTVAGINDYDSNGVIENQESETNGIVPGNGTVNLGGAGFYSYNGFIRDKNANGTTQVVINKTGTGTQVLSGGNVIYTGNTSVTGGILRLIQTTAFNSNITVTGGSTLELLATGTWNFGSFQNGTGAITAGTGHDITFGSSSAPTTHDNLTISGTSNLSVNQNVLTVAGGGAANLNVLPNATTANTFVFNGGKNSFNNLTFNALYLPSLNTFTTLQFQLENPQETGSISASTITLPSTAGILVGMTATGPSGSLGTVTAVLSATQVMVSGSATGSGAFSFQGGSEAFAGNAVVTGPFAAVDVQAPTAIVGSLTITRSKFTVEPSTNVTTVAGGTLSAGSIVLGGSTLDTIFTINNNAGAIGTGQNSGDRVSSAPITSNGGQIVYGGDTTTSHSETLGTLALTSGDLEITTSGVTAGTETLAFGALSRSQGSTITFSNTGIGAATNSVTFAGQAAGFMGGWATVSSTTIVGGLEFAKYVAGTGVTAMSGADYVGGYTANANVKLTAATSPVGTNTINSLNIQSTTALTIAVPTGQKLIITSGGLLDDGASHTINGPGTLTAGPGADLIPTVASGQTLTFGTSLVIADNGSAMGLTKAGIGQLLMLETTNTFSGPVYLNEGNVQIAGNGTLGTGTAINFDGGSLSLATSGTTISRAMNIGPGGGQLAVAPGSTSTVSSTITGSGVLTLIDNYEASTALASGTLNLTGLLTLPGGLETNNALSTAGAPSSLSSGQDTTVAVVNVTGTNDTFGHIRVNGATLNLGGATTIDTITGDIVMSSGTLNLFGTNNLTSIGITSGSGPTIYVAGGSLVLNSAGALGNATSAFNGTPIGYTGGTNPVNSTGLTLSGGTGGTVYLNGFNLMVNVLIGSSSSTESFVIDETPTGGTDTGRQTTLFVNTASNNTFTGSIEDESGFGATSTLGLTKMGTGNLTIGTNIAAGALINNYGGATSVLGGVLTVVNLSVGGNPSSIGESSNAASNLVIGNGAALAFAGTTEQFTDRSFTIASAGADAASVIADGASRNAIIHFGDDQTTTPGASKVAYASGIAGQALTLTLGGFNQGDNSFNEVVTNNGAGVVSLNKIGNGTWLLTENNTYTGLTTISGGSLAVTVNNALGSATGGTILEGGASTQSFTVGGVLDFRNVIYSTPEPIFMEGGELAATTGISSFTGPINVSLASTIQIFDSTSLTLSGAMSGVGSINQLGQGTLILSGNNSARQSTLAAWTVQAGELELDYTADIAAVKANGTINGGQPYHKLTFTGTNGAALTLGGSRLGGELFINDGTTQSTILRNNVSTTNTVTLGGTFFEVFSGLTLNAGENQIVNSQPNAWFSGTGGTNVNNDTVPTVIMVLNGITVAAGATLNLNESGIATTSKQPLSGGGILGAWATVGQNDWATTGQAFNGLAGITNNNYIVGLSVKTGGGGYTTNIWTSGNANTTGGAGNIDMTASTVEAVNANAITTLRYNTPSATPIAVTMAPGNNYIASGGIMVTAAVGSTDVFLNPSASGSTVTAGTGATGNYPNQDFIIYQYNTNGKFVISSPIQNNNFNTTGTDGINKLGAGTLVLTGSNTYTGFNTLTNGTVSINSFGPAGFALNTGIASTDVVGFNVVYGDTAGLTIGQTISAGAGFTANAVKVIQILDPNHYVVGDVTTGAPVNASSSNTASSFTFSATGTIGGAFSSTTVAGSNQVTVSGTIGAGQEVIVIGEAISGTGIPEGSYVTGILDSTHILISSAATVSSTNTLNYASGASNLGAATNGGINSGGTPTPTIVLNGGALQYTGQSALTDRAILVNFNAKISVSDPNTILTMSNIIQTGGNIGDYVLTKSGEGTLRFTDATTNGYGITGYVANQGRLQLYSAFANDRYARNDVATLTVSGGAFEFIGDPIASRSQALPGQYSVGVGQSQVEVTSQIGVTTTLTLQAASGPLIVNRSVGGTVQYIENPGPLNGVATLAINVPSFYAQTPIGYAVFSSPSAPYFNTDIGVNSQPGINDFAAIDANSGNVIGASTINGAYFVASSESEAATDPSQWFTLGASPALSEGTFSFNTGSSAGPMGQDTHVSVLRYFASSTSNIDLGGFTLAIDQGGLLNSEAVGHNSKIIQNGNLTSGLGDLILQNYNYSAPLQIKANIVDNKLGSGALAFNQTSTIEVLSVANFTVGESVQGNYTDPNTMVTYTNFFPPGTTVKAINAQTSTLVLSTPITLPNGDTTFNDEGFITILYNQSIGLTQAGQSVTKTIAQIALSTVGDIGNVTSGTNTIQLNNGSTTAGLMVGMVISGVGIPAGTTITGINAGLDTVTMSANATSTNLTLGITFVQLGTTSSTLAAVGRTILSGANTYTGSTFIEGGVLELASAMAIPGGIGASGGTSAIIIDGGQIGVDTTGGSFQRGVGPGTSQIQFLGSGGFTAYGSPGTPLVINLGGNATPTTLAWGYNSFLNDDSIFVLSSPDSDSTVNFANPINLGVLNRVVRTDNGTAAVDAMLSGVLSSDGGGLIKTGYGTLELTATSAAPNSYTGGTTVASGNLYGLNPASAFGSGPIGLGNTTDSDIDDNVMLTLGAGTAGNSVTVGTVNSTGVTVVSSASTTAGVSGAVNLERDLYLQAPTGQKLTLSGVVSGVGGITVIGGGDVYIGNSTTANSYGTNGSTPVGPGAGITGGTVVRSGTIHLLNIAGLGATTVELGDVIKVLAPVVATTNSTSITMLGGTFDPSASASPAAGNGVLGAFFNVSNVVNGVTFTSANADTNPGDGTGARILIKDDAGNPERNGIYEVVSVTIATATSAGTMELVRVADFSNPSIGGNTTINMTYGSQVTDTSTGITYFMASNTVNNVNTPDADPTAWLVDNANPNVSLVTEVTGTIANNVDVNNTNGTGTSTIGGSSTFTTGSATYSGAITLQDVTGTAIPTPKTLLLSSFTNTGDGVIFTGLISEANSADDTLSLQTTGSGSSGNVGVVTLDPTSVSQPYNTYHGGTTVAPFTILRAETGTVNVSGSNYSALGFGDSTAATGTVVQTNGELQLSSTSGISITTEALTINGTGTNATNGALNNVAGNNTWGGTITVGSDGALIAAVTGTTLTLNNATSAVNLNGHNGGFGGTGTTVVSGIITNGTGTGSITKSNTGTLTLQNANTYVGLTTINGGIVKAENNNALGTTAAGTVVNSGGELDLVGGASGGATSVTVGAEALTLNGIGAGGAALYSVSTAANVTNTYEGPITVGSSGATVGASANATSAATLALGDSTSHPAIIGTGTLTTVGTTSGTNVGTTLIVDPINVTGATSGLTVASGLTVLNNATASTYSGPTTVSSTTAAGTILQVGVLGIGSTGTGGGATQAVNVSATTGTATLAGTGTVNGSTTIGANGVVAPGDNGGSSIGTLTFNSKLTLGASSSITLQINDTAPSLTNLTFDVVKGTGSGNTLTLNGSSNITLVDSGSFAGNAFADETFDLLNWATIAGNGFSAGTTNVRAGGTSGNLTLPNISPTLAYDVTAFLSTGVITIVNAPEPSRILLIVSGMAMIMMRRRRRTV